MDTNQENLEKLITNPVKAIRAKCLDCCCYNAEEVKLCTCVNCPLYPFRLGKNPYRKEKSEEAKQAARERMTARQAAKKKQLTENQ